jgi:hypothetical protein
VWQRHNSNFHTSSRKHAKLATQAKQELVVVEDKRIKLRYIAYSAKCRHSRHISPLLSNLIAKPFWQADFFSSVVRTI